MSGHLLLDGAPQPGGRYTPILVGSRRVCAMVDSGADEVIIRQDCVPPDARLRPLDKRISLADGGACVHIIGKTSVTIVSSKLFDQCLLGVKYLTEIGTCLDMGRGLLTIEGEALPLTRRPIGPRSQTARVVVRDTVMVRAGTEVICSGEMCSPADTSLDSTVALLEGEDKFLERSPLLIARLAVTFPLTVQFL